MLNGLHLTLVTSANCISKIKMNKLIQQLLFLATDNSTYRKTDHKIQIKSNLTERPYLRLTKQNSQIKTSINYNPSPIKHLIEEYFENHRVLKLKTTKDARDVRIPNVWNAYKRPRGVKSARILAENVFPPFG